LRRAKSDLLEIKKKKELKRKEAIELKKKMQMSKQNTSIATTDKITEVLNDKGESELVF
jgi:hypothetical protein